MLNASAPAPPVLNDELPNENGGPPGSVVLDGVPTPGDEERMLGGNVTGRGPVGPMLCGTKRGGRFRALRAFASVGSGGHGAGG